MKIQLRRLDGDTLGVMALTDERGRMLPGQRAVAVETSPDDLPVVTVTFVLVEGFVENALSLEVDKSEAAR